MYEQDFLPCSFGFRPSRSAHQALQTLYTACMSQRLRWVLDIDIEKYFEFDSALCTFGTFLTSEFTDGVIRRMIDKWLKGGSPGRWPPAPHNRRLPTGRCDLTLPLKHLPAPCAG